MRFLKGAIFCLAVLGIAYLALLLDVRPVHGQVSYTLPDPAPTCKPMDPETHVCLIAFTGQAQDGTTVLKPLARVTVHIGNQSLQTGQQGWIAADVLKTSKTEVKAIAPIGYRPDPGSEYAATNGPVIAVRVLVPIK